MGAAAPTTAPSGATVPRPVRDLEALIEEVRSLRYMPLEDFERAAINIAVRIANAEATAYDLAHGGGR